MSERNVIGICPQCGADLTDPSRPCPSCGSLPSPASQLPTAAAPRTGVTPTTPTSPIGRIDTPASGRTPVFTPGEMLAGRYRIIGLLGRGGMGEVYRADDLELGQAVSLKFLPRSFADAPGALDRFRAEVRNARQVSHPNVCRVYDIGEYQGLHFLSMEFVDGEDLATLLRRIGRLPPAKANEVASQLCAGLAAAHDRGVLHRDLKPANVMLDGEGHVRITDFGLAVRAEEGVAEFSGTPAYMAPENFAGAPATVRSDLYSLGLVLYEIYTGKRTFEAGSVAEWKSRHTESAPTLPSLVEHDVDESVERAILRCLEKDPSRRPASARQLAAALPGGDPLAAALAAGETPSPELVAASGGEGAISRRAAGSLALAALLSVIAVVALGPYSGDLGLSPMTKSAEVLRDRSRQILARFGYGASARDEECWLERDYLPMLHVSRSQPSTKWRREWRTRPATIQLVHRRSPRWMFPLSGNGTLSRAQPAHDVTGMTMTVVDANGALRYLQAVPPQMDSTRADSAGFDWGALFAEAGLDLRRFVPARPVWVPLTAYDARAEWTGEREDLPGVPLRVSAAAFGGRPVYFEVIGPWTKPQRDQPATESLTQKISGYAIGALSVVALITGAFFVRRNLRLGRGDRRGATRLATFVFLLSLLNWIVGGHHVPSFAQEAQVAALVTSFSLFGAVMLGLLYLAIEPYVRRHIPELLIGWARLLEGRFRDPRVARDVLIGAVFGGILALSVHLSNALPTWIPILGQTPVPPSTLMVEGGRHLVAAVLNAVNGTSLPAALVTFCFFFVLRLLLRRHLAAMIVMMGVMTLTGLGGENLLLETPFAVVFGVVVGLCLARFGLLAAASMVAFRTLLAAVPLPLDVTVPYAFSTVTVLALLVATIVVATRFAVGSRPLFTAPSLGE